MISLLLTLAFIGFLVWAITTFIPMPAVFKTGIYAIAGICVLLYLLQVFGFADVPIPHFHSVR